MAPLGDLTSRSGDKAAAHRMLRSARFDRSEDVAVKIKDDALTKLRLLNELHGIGVIRLDPYNPADDSAIEIPARERFEVDWGTCNMITSENKDFLRFIQLPAHCYDTKATSIKEWDIPQHVLVDV